MAFSQPDLTYDPSIIETSRHELDAFFDEKPSQAFFDGLKKLNSLIQIQQFEEEKKDWLAEWKKRLSPFQTRWPILGCTILVASTARMSNADFHRPRNGVWDWDSRDNTNDGLFYT